MVKKANGYNIKLTLMFTAQCADYISESPERTTEFEEWKKQGKTPEEYLGTLDDFIKKLKKINPNIHSGYMNSEHDKEEMPDEIERANPNLCPRDCEKKPEET
ncbi:MAG: hypothetical protein WAW67_04995 [Candidatus Omnitrophota bacterium]